MKKVFIIVLILILGSILTLKFVSRPFANSDTIIGRISNILNRNNKVDLSCTGIDRANINITWYSETANSRLIIKNGEQVGKIGYEYGSNGFRIKLKNGLEFTVGHFKTNNWHSHDYEFKIIRDTLGYRIKFIANGPDFEWYEQCFDNSGLPNGMVCGQFENGNFSYMGNYGNGLREGRFVDGRIRSTIDYVNDTLNGFVIDYEENGKTLWKTKYVKGHEVKENE